MRLRPALLALGLAAALAPATGRAQASKYNLKPGGGGRVCLGCHVTFGDVLKRPSVHTPVKALQCTGCHSPHTSNHPKLLAAAPDATCGGCHGSVTPAQAKSVHRPVAEAKCTSCHDPHGSGFKANLVKGGRDLCATCHKGIVEAASKATAKHRPLEQSGCGACHLAHGSAQGPSLLRKAVPALCVECHRVDRPAFLKQHLGYTVGKKDCTSCHDPHGSSRRGMLYDKVHAPVARGMCNQCHGAAGSADQFATKAAASALCKGCHAQKLQAMMEKNRIHAPVVEGAGCLNCHAPHASKEKGLLRGDIVTVCGSCHAESIKRAERSDAKHPPVVAGECTACHDPHSGNRPLLFTDATVVTLCGTCHDWLQHSSHPMGDKAKDPRNRNLTVDCLSCHRGHGTEHKKLLLEATQPELCTKCHTKYRG
ncbi:MAG TPA: cytochrome c3 family protein [Anaeromyxobacteraceae bacterium]|nr:cytochrome c3 family protein [Anaeromyxobacteraceae bacterium]